MRKVLTSTFLSLVMISLVGKHANSVDWDQFLVQDRNCVSTETGLISTWPSAGPKIVWRTPLGVSMSGVAVAKGAAFTMFQDEKSQYVVCLNAADGKELWRTPIGPVYENAMGHGPRATPTVSDGHVFAFTGEGILVALKADDGKQLWSVTVPKLLSGKPNEYGVSCSPLVTGSHVIVHSGTKTAAVAAFGIADGKLAWKVGSGNAGYSSPVLMTLNGETQIVSLTGSGAIGIEPGSGKEQWSFPFPTEYDCNTSSPVRLDDQHVLISAGENHGSVILEVKADKNGPEVEEVWSSLGKDSQLRAEWQTPVVHDGHLYGLDNQGSAGPITSLICMRLKDHKTMWQKNRFGKSNLILADGKLYLTTMEGEVVIVEASAKEFHELSRATIMDTTRQAPSLANGRLFVRDDKEVVCLDVKAP
ncbi:MAG: PQQ-binding-like beta-propeller repeat protein [Planctomycetaceae bacterium]